MLRLADGLYAHLMNAPQPSEIRSLAGDVRIPVPAEHAGALAALAQGLVDDDESPLAAELIVRGLAQRDTAPVDPVVFERLRALGHGFGWTLTDDERARSLVELLRRGHARRKLFVHDFGQTPCLPESGAARCLAFADVVKPGARVLLIGDDDLLSLALAQLGYDVTSIDIDPHVIAFVAQVARDEGLTIDARVYDVLAPLDPEMVERYDAVLTDPMSYEKCQIAFLSRALAVVKQGGYVFSCVHPIARQTFARVAALLPVVVESYRYHFSAYTYYDYAENTYRSDLVTLRRREGDLPHAPSSTIPFEHITEGFLSDGFHGLGDIYGMRLGQKRDLTSDDVLRVIAHVGHDVAHASAHETDGKLHVAAFTRAGGHVSVVVDRKRARIGLHVWPYDDARDAPLLQLLSPLVKGVRTSLWFTDAPHIPARVVVVE
jgi:hypothetical protein